MSQTTTTTMLKHRTTPANAALSKSPSLPPLSSSTSQQQQNGISLNSSGANLTKSESIKPSKRIYTKPNYSILWPSRFLNAIFGPKIYKLILYCTWIFWFVCGVFVLRKTGRATKAVYYVKEHAHTVSLGSIEESDRFKELIKVLDKDFTRPPAFLLLNQYALNMTFNFLSEHWPNIRQLYWPTPSLYVSL
uniref:Uncharacterized protein n=1 Tax=Panagrolaimus sp. ES5 TaxID=591445 RepID=A0AC34FNL0_9BILA